MRYGDRFGFVSVLYGDAWPKVALRQLALGKIEGIVAVVRIYEEDQLRQWLYARDRARCRHMSMQRSHVPDKLSMSTYRSVVCCHNG